MRRRASQFGLSSNNLSHNAILKKIASYIVLFSCTRAPKVLICPFTHVYTSISTSKDFLSNIDTLMSALGETQGSVFGPHPRYAHCTTNHPALPPDPQPHWSCEVCFFQNSCFHFIICKFVVLNCPRRKKIKALAFKKSTALLIQTHGRNHNYGKCFNSRSVRTRVSCEKSALCSLKYLITKYVR